MEREPRRERFARVVDGERVRHPHRLRHRRGVSRVVPGDGTRVVVLQRSTTLGPPGSVHLRLRLRRRADGHAASRRHRHQVARGEIADDHAPRRAQRRRAPVRRRRVRVRVGERKRRQRRAPGMRDTRCFVVSPARRRRRGGRRGRRVRERVPAPRRRARRSGPARVHQRSAHPLCRSAALLPPVEVREVRVVVHLVVVHHRRRQNGLPVRPEPPRTAHADAAGETPRERSPRRRSRRRRPRDGLGRGGEHTVLRETRLGVRRGLLRRFRVHGRRLPRRLRGFSGFSASLPRARRGGGRRRGVGRTRRRSGGGRAWRTRSFLSLPLSPFVSHFEQRLGNKPRDLIQRVIQRDGGHVGERVRERRVRARRFAGFHLRLPPRRRERAPHQTRELRLRHALRLEDALDALVPASRAVPAERSFLGASLGRRLLVVSRSLPFDAPPRGT